MSGGILDYRYLVKGFFESIQADKKSGKKGELIPLEKSFDTRRNEVVISQDLNSKAGVTTQIWRTNINGVLYKSQNICHRNLAHTLHHKWSLSLIHKSAPISEEENLSEYIIFEKLTREEILDFMAT